MGTLTVSTQLATTDCPKCGGLYAISAAYEREAQQLGNFTKCWFCPYCRESTGFGHNEVQKLQATIATLEQSKKVLEEQKRSAEQKQSDAEQEAAHFRKSRDGIKGVLAKERKRVGNGACPCCNRSFVNLQRHMATKHPEHKTSPTP